MLVVAVAAPPLRLPCFPYLLCLRLLLLRELFFLITAFAALAARGTLGQQAYQ